MSEPKVIVAGWCTVDPKRRDEAVEIADLALVDTIEEMAVVHQKAGAATTANGLGRNSRAAGGIAIGDRT